MKPLVSVLIPLYNAKEYLEETINSVKDQTYQNIEIIIVDDGSTDGSYEYAKTFENVTVKVYRQKNSGPGTARNKAFALSKGDYIQYLDADDLLAPNKIELQYKAIKKYGDDTFVFGNCEHFNDLTNEKFLQKQSYFKDYNDSDDFLMNYWRESGMIPTGSYLCSRKLIEKAEKWNEKWILNEDGDFVARLAANAKFIKFIPDSLMYYRRSNADSLNNRRTRKHFESMLESFQRRNEYIKSTLENDSFKYAQYLSYSRLYHQMFPKYKDLRDIVKNEIIKLGYRQIYPVGGENFMKLAKLIGTNNTYFIAEKIIEIREKIGLK